nr:lysozyme inhibitor LprI family protein [uncultured Blautia sp.]
MKRKILKITFFIAAISTGIAVNSIENHVYAAETYGTYSADTDPYFQNDMNLYCQYVESHELSDYLDGSAGIFGDARGLDIYVQKIKVADFDGDNRAEVWITGPAAASNSIAGILDISGEEVKCVFNGWGNELGRYTDPETGKTGIVIEEGNSDGDGYSHTRVSLYDENWDNTILMESESNGIAEEETESNTSQDDGSYMELWRSCNEVKAVSETESDRMGKEDVTKFLQGLASTVPSGNSQSGSITGYPEYDEIVNQYYNGMALNWSTEDFREHNLCYLAGYETGVDRIGYCVRDINGDGVDELMIGRIDEYSDPGMFYDLYTMIDGQRVLVKSSGERDRYYLCQDQTIANEGSGGAVLSVWGYYDFVSGQLQLKESVFMDGNTHPENPWFYTTTAFFEDYSNPISDEEAENIINKYTYETIPYISLADINNQSDVAESGTSSFRQQAEQEVNETEQQASVVESGNEQYEIWDRCLNDVWGYLQEALSSEEMETLIQEEMDWIQNKENIINTIKMQSVEEALKKAAEITRERVYDLLNML